MDTGRIQTSSSTMSAGRPPPTDHGPGGRRIGRVGWAVLDLVVLLALWLALSPVRRMVSQGAPLSPWIDLLLVVPVLLSWLGLRILQPGRFAADAPAGVLLIRLAPVAVVVALSPDLLLLVRTDPPVVALPVLMIFGVGLLTAMVLVRVVFGRRCWPCAQETAGRWVWLLAAGAVCAAAASQMLARPMFGEGLWASFGRLFVRDGLRLAAALAVAVFVAASVRPERWYPVRLIRRVRAMRSRVMVLMAGFVSALASGLFACFVLDRIPHVQDEIAMLFQARNFAAGQLYARTPPLPECFDQEFIVIDGEKWYGKYFAGPAVYYLPGVLLGVPWLVSPVVGGLSVAVLFVLARELVGERLGRWAVLLAVLSPFWMLTFASMMSHPGCLLLLAGFAASLVHAARKPGRLFSALLAGLALGASLHFRPWTVMAIGSVVLAAVLISPLRANIRLRAVAAFLAPVAVAVGLMLAYNQALTGQALLTPFEKYSPSDRLGFGPDRGLETWPARDRGHDLHNAMKNLNLNLEALATSLFGWPRAALLVCLAGALAGSRRVRWALAAAAVAPAVAYSFYHYCGVVYGPRYWSEALPAMLILAAMGLAVLRAGIRRVLRAGAAAHASVRSRIAVALFLMLCVTANAVDHMPELIRSYGAGLWGVDTVPRDTVRTAGIHNAVVLIRTASFRQARNAQDKYGAGFLLNSPNLDDDVIFARDLGPVKTRELMRQYPNRSFYRLVRSGCGHAKLERVSAPRSGARASIGHGMVPAGSQDRSQEKE